MSKRLFWDMERKAKLRAMWARGANAKELTEAFGITMHSISQRANRMGLGPRVAMQPHEVVRKALKALGSATIRELEKHTGMSHSAVDRAIYRLQAFEEAAAIGTRRVSAGRGHATTVEATVYGLIDDEEHGAVIARGDGLPRVNRVKHRPGTAAIPPRHEITAALFGSA